MRIMLGSKVKDRITGFVGVAVAYDTWINGCERYAVQSECGEDGKIPDLAWIDNGQLEILEPAIKEEKPAERRTTGGPQQSKTVPNAR